MAYPACKPFGDWTETQGSFILDHAATEDCHYLEMKPTVGELGDTVGSQG